MHGKSHILGDATAEVDHIMLEKAFLETADFTTVVSSDETPIIVGRRGTGKSAMFYQLNKLWSKEKKIKLVRFTPEDYDLIALQHFIKIFGDTYNLKQAISKVFFRYAFIMESAAALAEHYRHKNISGIDCLRIHLRDWRKLGAKPFERLRRKIEIVTDSDSQPSLLIGELVKSLEIEKLEHELATSIISTKIDVIVLVDRVDEGLEPGKIGTALIDGLTSAAVLQNTSIPGYRTILFLRDNIARAIAENNPDYTRNLESRILRLHWDERALFYLICKRIRVAFNINEERDLDAWNQVTSQDLKGRSGFRVCLRLTLYRPRDLLVLLNKAFYNAHKNSRSKIDNSDVNASAIEISENRKRDLIQEYSDTIPGLAIYIASFSSSELNFSYTQALDRLKNEFASPSITPAAKSHIELVGTLSILRSLYSIGFLGLKSDQAGSFVFSHDGKAADVELSTNSKLIVHPCYWLALGISDYFFKNREQAEEIHDDLDIEVTTQSSENRNRRIGQILAELQDISLGTEGASQFEEWCEEVIRILFAGSLENVELHPNGNASQRRDIVGTNSERNTFWKRVYSDYQTRQVIFEVKNVDRDLKPEEFRQMLSYSGKAYGKIVFIISRSEENEVRKGRELDWIQELYNQHTFLVVKLTAKFLSGLLSKQRNTEKFSIIEKKMSGLLDRYTRMYLAGGRR